MHYTCVVKSQRAFTAVELAAVITLVAVLAVVLVPTLVVKRREVQSARCQENLKQIGAACTMYSRESRGERWPRVYGIGPGSTIGADALAHCLNYNPRFSFGVNASDLFPEYLTDPVVLVCPARRRGSDSEAALGIVRDDGSGRCEHEGLISDPGRYYTYIGYLLFRCDETAQNGLETVDGIENVPELLRVFFAALEPLTRPEAFAASIGTGVDIPVEELQVCPVDHVYQYREGVERFVMWHLGDEKGWYVRRIIPVLWDRLHVEDFRAKGRGHRPPGCNALFIDGHVEFIPCGPRFPATLSLSQMLERHEQRSEVQYQRGRRGGRPDGFPLE